MRATTIGVIAALCLTVLVPAAANAAEEPGPPLRTPTSVLDAAVRCGPDVATRKTVLLVHGTGSTGSESWSWGYQRALPALGFAVCTVDLPQRSTISMWKQIDYMVYAVRKARQLSGQQISVVGHSQGGFYPLWAIKFWPDVRDAIDDYIGLAPGVHGTQLGNTVCAPGQCTDIAWQVRFGSDALTALHRGGLGSGVSYTTAWTRTDEIVFPQPAASRINGGSNIAVQDICPGRVAEHLTMLADNAAWAIAADALTHPGQADPARINRAACRRPFLPDFDPVGFAAATPVSTVGFSPAVVTGPMTGAEPPVPSYAV